MQNKNKENRELINKVDIMEKFTASLVKNLKKQKINIEFYKIKSKYLQKNRKLSWLLNLLSINFKTYKS